MSKTVLITGAASGLGKALATTYAESTCQLYLVDKDLAGVEALAKQLKNDQVKCFPLACDITSQSDIEALLATIKQANVKLDVLINNAGVATAGALEFEDIEQWQWVLNINLLGLVRLTQAFAQDMNNPSQIINIASQAGITPIPLMASYNASKAAVVSFSETMHLELAPRGIHVAVACPSFFATNLDKSLRSSQPGVDKLMQKFLSRSSVTAEQVASIIIKQAQARKFMILTHKDGKRAFCLKRFLPSGTYLNMIKKKTQHLGNLRVKK